MHCQVGNSHISKQNSNLRETGIQIIILKDAVLIKYTNTLTNLEAIFKYAATPTQYILSLLVAFVEYMNWLIMDGLYGRNSM